MRLATVKQCQEIEELSQSVYGLSGEILMESAGALAARELELRYFPEIKRGQLSVVCGPGNNGGDGLVLARHLHSAGHRNVVVYIFAPEKQRSSLFDLQIKRVESQGIRIIDLDLNKQIWESLRSSELIVDSVFGIGLSRAVEGEYLKLIELINSIKVPVASIDCPSGLNCDTGRIMGQAIRADSTISFGLAKPGFFVSEGPRYVGKLKVIPIGFPYETLRGIATSHFLFTEKLARRYLPKRAELANKSHFGHLLIAAGSSGHWGSGVLSSMSAFRLGCGYVTWASFENPDKNLLETPEVMTKVLSKELILNNKFSAVAIGPGLGRNQFTADIIRELKNIENLQVVIDADGIRSACDFNLFPFPSHWVITPHSGELSQIIGEDVKNIEEDRFSAALKAFEMTGCHVLLKGYRSVLAHGGRCMVIQSGNSALAKAGTGDVLTGMVGSLLAQGLDTLQATATAAYIHGRIADEWVRIGNDKRTLTASDLKDHLPNLVGRMTSGALSL